MSTPAKPPPPPRYFTLGLVVLGLAATGIVLAVVTHRLHRNRGVVRANREMAIATVTTLHAKVDRSDLHLTLPGNVEAFYDAPIYARTNGYLKRWNVDIGAEVKAGQILAEIETPEIDQELNQAYAVREQAKANLALAQTTAARWLELLQKNAVARQDVDEKTGNLAAQQAALAAASADVRRLENLQGFKNITAPFDGIVTTRNTDLGDLINSGGGNAGRELFRVAQIGTLRIYVSVPEVYSSSIAIGLSATIELASAPNHPVEGKVTGTAKAIDPASRTLLTELQVPNPGGLLLPGSYATVNFHVPVGTPPLVVPVNTILFRPAGAQIGVVGADGIVALKNVRIGRNFGTTVEIVGGLQAEDAIILNPSDSLNAGAKVRTRPMSSL